VFETVLTSLILSADSRRSGELKVLWKAWRRNLPQSLIGLMMAKDFTAEDRRFSEFLNAAKAEAQEMLTVKMQTERGENNKDILSILGESPFKS
jgi:hypothetical protein